VKQTWQTITSSLRLPNFYDFPKRRVNYSIVFYTEFCSIRLHVSAAYFSHHHLRY